jgi:predicted metal-binding protein
MIKKINLNKNPDMVQKDLGSYVQKALEFSAFKAAVIPASNIVVAERVTLKCRIPRCPEFGMSTNCTPNALKPA